MRYVAYDSDDAIVAQGDLDLGVDVPEGGQVSIEVSEGKWICFEGQGWITVSDVPLSEG